MKKRASERAAAAFETTIGPLTGETVFCLSFMIATAGDGAKARGKVKGKEDCHGEGKALRSNDLILPGDFLRELHGQ